MNCTSTIVVGIGFAFAAALTAVPAQAQNSRSFVSPTGNDSNNCTLTAPCRGFTAALAVTNAGGEIAVLGTAGYGTVIINKAVSIVNPGGFEAGVTIPSGGTGIVVNTTGSVKLQGLTIEGGGIGNIGIDIQAVGNILIDNCRVYDLVNQGILFEPNTSVANAGIGVRESLISDTNTAIDVVPSGSGIAQVNVHHTDVRRSTQYGVLVDSRSSTGKVLSVVSGSGVHSNSTAGLAVISNGTALFTDMMVFHSLISGNVIGILAQGTGALLWIGQSVVANNTNGWEATSGGVVQSYTTNQIAGNAANQGQAPAVTNGSN